MKIFLSVIFLTFFLHTISFSQIKTLVINDAIIGPGGMVGIESIHLPDHSVVTIGNCYYTPGRIVVFKISETGNVIWSRVINTENHNPHLYAFDIISTLDDGFLITGLSASNNSRTNNAEVFKLDQNGFLQWGTEFMRGSSDRAFSAIQLADSSFIICGQSADDSTQYDQALLIKLDPAGNPIWTKSRWDRSAERIIKTTDGYGIITQYHFVRFDLSDSLRSDWIIGNSQQSGLTDVIQTRDHGFVFSGVIFLSTGDTDSFVLKTDSSGNVLWSMAMNLSSWEGISSVVELANGDLFICSDTTFFNNVYSCNSSFVFELNSSGNFKWGNYIADSTRIYRAIELTDGDILLTGSTMTIGTTPAYEKILLMEIDSLGNGCMNVLPLGNTYFDSTLVATPTQPDSFIHWPMVTYWDGKAQTGNIALNLFCGNFATNFEIIRDEILAFNVSPNPSSGVIYIDSESQFREIEICDMSGKLVLHQESSNSKIDISFLKTGIYFVKIVFADDEVGYKKIILNR